MRKLNPLEVCRLGFNGRTETGSGIIAASRKVASLPSYRIDSQIGRENGLPICYKGGTGLSQRLHPSSGTLSAEICQVP